MKDIKLDLQLFAIGRRKEIEKLKNEASDVYQKFQASDRYKEQKGIITDAKRSVDFYEGRQWRDFKNRLPFENPTINVVGNMVDSKAASILNKTWTINYVVNDDTAQTDKINKFTEWQMKQLKQDELNARLTYDGLNKGTFILYLYWDEDAVGQMGVMDGSVKATTIDIQDIAVANPTNTDVQTQEYIIIHSRESIRKVKEICDTLISDKEKDELIIPYEYESNYTNDVEQNNEVMTDVYTKFFKKDGEVYFQKSTKDILIQKPTPLNPFVTKSVIKQKQKELEEEKKEHTTAETEQIGDPINQEMMTKAKDEKTPKEELEEKLKATDYPIAMNSFIKRDNCIYGVSFTAQLIAPQKNINQLVATTLLTATKHAMPTIVVKQGALGTQSLDFSKPGKVIVDYSPPGEEGVKSLNLGTLPTKHYELAQSMIAMLKDVYRTNDILNDGRNTVSGLSGYAMSLISSLQDKPIAQWQQELARLIEQEGRILETFYKLYYRNKKFTSQRTDAEVLKMKNENPNMNIAQSTTDIFNGEDYLETPFNVSVEVSEGAKTNETSMVGLMETLFLNGTIEKLSPDTLMMWCELIPNSVFPKKNQLKLLIEQRQNSMITQLTQQVQDLTNQLEQTAAREKFKEQEYNGAVAQYQAQLKNLQNQGRFMAALQGQQQQAKNKTN